MKFSARTFYGLKAVFVLAERYGEGSLSVSHIASRENISVSYLEQILNALKNSGLAKSVRGPQGGYILAKKPSEISIFELLGALEGKSFLNFSSKLPMTTSSEETVVAHFIFWKKFEALIEKELGQMNLKQLLDEARHLKKTKSVSRQQAFHI